MEHKAVDYDEIDANMLAYCLSYQRFVEDMRTPGGKHHGLTWSVMGMAAEAGEALAEIEKSWRKERVISRENMVSELGDVLYFLASACNDLNIDLVYLMEHNIDKLSKRHAKQE